MPKIVDHEARRRDFIAAAYQTIMEEGLANTTVRGVAKKAGYTTGALVHYFADKEELIREALDYFGREVRDRMQSGTAEAGAPHFAKPSSNRCRPTNDRRRAGVACGWRSGTTPSRARTCAPRSGDATASGTAASRRDQQSNRSGSCRRRSTRALRRAPSSHSSTASACSS